jgi:hypothetical protein
MSPCKLTGNNHQSKFTEDEILKLDGYREKMNSSNNIFVTMISDWKMKRLIDVVNYRHKKQKRKESCGNNEDTRGTNTN